MTAAPIPIPGVLFRDEHATISSSSCGTSDCSSARSEGSSPGSTPPTSSYFGKSANCTPRDSVINTSPPSPATVKRLIRIRYTICFYTYISS